MYVGISFTRVFDPPLNMSTAGVLSKMSESLAEYIARMRRVYSTERRYRAYGAAADDFGANSLTLRPSKPFNYRSLTSRQVAVSTHLIAACQSSRCPGGSRPYHYRGRTAMRPLKGASQSTLLITDVCSASEMIPGTLTEDKCFASRTCGLTT